MKNLKFVAKAIFLLIFVQSLNAQQTKWEIGIGPQMEIMSYKMSNHQAINTKYRNKKQVGGSYGINIKLDRKLKDQWTIGVELGTQKTTYQLLLDRDFGDLDDIIGFSEPTKTGDYTNISRIEYNNAYFKWGVNLKYNFSKNAERTFQPYVGFGLEQRLLRSSDTYISYRDTGAGSILWTFFTLGAVTPAITHAPTASQRQEALDYYNDDMAQSPVFVDFKLGFKWQLPKYISFSVEPFMNLAANTYHKNMIKSQVNMGVSSALNIRF